jgi:hypothetical protein
MEPFATDALPPGTVIGGRYTVSAPLGVGGMSTVYDALDGWTGRRVALKVLNPTLALHGEVVARFVQEAHAAAGFSHPNIVEVLEVNEALRADPSLANSDPQGAGWFFKVKLADAAQLEALMDEAAYKGFAGD